MNGPKAPRDPSTGRRDWEYNEPINRNSFSFNEEEDDDDDDDFESDEYSDPYADNPWDEPMW